jgi:tetratricopeptide (TPR) repeat protein
MTASSPPPPIVTAAQKLPLGDLSWESFEDLCVRLAARDAPSVRTSKFGDPGQDQSGIDIYARRRDGTFITFQCRRIRKMGPAAIRNAVADFQTGEWADRATEFVLCTTASAVRSDRANEIEKQAELLRSRTPPIAFDVWDLETLSRQLKDHPDLVEEFFGTPWLERFLPGHASRRDQDAIADIQTSLDGLSESVARRAQIITIDWAPERLQATLKSFGEDDPDRFGLLVDAVGMPPRRDDVRELIADPPQWAVTAEDDFWELAARVAESVGAWEAASGAWSLCADRRGPDAAVRALMSGAAAAKVGEMLERQQVLVARAAEIDPSHPLIELERLTEGASPPDIVEALTDLLPRVEHPDDRLMATAHLALGYLLTPDLRCARRLVDEVQAAAPGAVVTRSLALNLSLQTGRVAVMRSRPLDAGDLTASHYEALKLRERLIAERRWDESARTLMLAADAWALLGDRSKAAETLRKAMPEELAAPTGAFVLADSAVGRALNARLALKFIEHAREPDSEVVRRIRAESLAFCGSDAERAEALQELEDLATADGEEGPAAAFIRLAMCLGGTEVAWSDAAESELRRRGYERVAITARVIYLSRWQAAHERADELLVPFADEPWAKVARMRIAIDRGAYGPLRATAAAVRADAPSQPVRVDVGGRSLWPARPPRRETSCLRWRVTPRPLRWRVPTPTTCSCRSSAGSSEIGTRLPSSTRSGSTSSRQIVGSRAGRRRSQTGVTAQHGSRARPGRRSGDASSTAEK